MWNNKNSIEDMIIFEDKDILVCHKAAGIAVQNARIGAADMESSLKNYLALKKYGNSSLSGSCAQTGSTG